MRPDFGPSVLAAAAVAYCQAYGHVWTWTWTWHSIGYRECTTCGLRGEVRRCTWDDLELERVAHLAAEGPTERDRRLLDLVAAGNKMAAAAAEVGLSLARGYQIAAKWCGVDVLTPQTMEG